MKTVGAYEAKTHLSKLLDEVQQGETIVITRHGVPVAQLVPAPGIDRKRVAEAIAALKELSKENTLEGITMRELIEEGRRY